MFYISLNDWSELNRHLRSIHELLRYIHKVLDRGEDVRVPIGHEFDRYKSFVASEAAYASKIRGAMGVTSFSAVEDPDAITSYHQLLERTWGPNEVVPGMHIEDYRPVLDFLDDVPAVVQANVGRWIFNRRKELEAVGHRVSGSTLLVDRPLIYMCDNTATWRNRERWAGTLASLTTLRAIEWREQKGGRNLVLGVGVRVMKPNDEYSYLLIRDGARLSAELRRGLEWTFGVANFKTFETYKLRVGRNEPCPCASGRKYKHCHGGSEGLAFSR
ncbi:MAG: YecA family protein [Streptosporangiaceae bacterium]